MKFYISDTHFFHENIIRICGRPYSAVEEMNDDMIKRWNSKVGPNDEVYFLGDFAFRYPNMNAVYNILDQLNGKKYFIKGNHDKTLKDIKFRSYFEWVKDYAEIDDSGRFVVLMHYPLEDWNGRYRNSYHLFGHIHNNYQDVRANVPRRFNVGVEVNGYEPKTLDELIQNK